MCHSYYFSVVCYLFLFYIFNTYFIVRSSVSAFGLFIVKLLVYFLKFSVYALHISQFFIASCFHSASFYFFGRLIKQFYCFLVVVVLPYYIIVFMTVLEPTNVQFAAHKSSFQTNTYINPPICLSLELVPYSKTKWGRLHHCHCHCHIRSRSRSHLSLWTYKKEDLDPHCISLMWNGATSIIALKR